MCKQLKGGFVEQGVEQIVVDAVFKSLLACSKKIMCYLLDNHAKKLADFIFGRTAVLIKFY